MEGIKTSSETSIGIQARIPSPSSFLSKKRTRQRSCRHEYLALASLPNVSISTGFLMAHHRNPRRGCEVEIRTRQGDRHAASDGPRSVYLRLPLSGRLRLHSLQTFTQMTTIRWTSFCCAPKLLVPLSMVQLFPHRRHHDGKTVAKRMKESIALPYGDPTYNSYKDISEAAGTYHERNVPFLFRVPRRWKARKPPLSPSRITRAPRKSSPIALPEIRTGIPAVRQRLRLETEMCPENVSVSPLHLPVSFVSHHFQAAAVNLFCSIERLH